MEIKLVLTAAVLKYGGIKMYKAIVDGVLVDLTTAEIVQLEAKQAEWLAGADERAATDVREKRNTLIAETDWWATSDRTMSAKQTAYRQALRDITAQAGFPTDITWPTKPE
jgi:hypothetical protein